MMPGSALQMMEGLQLLITLRQSPLEDHVAYLVPNQGSLELLLHQLAHVHCKWTAFEG